MRQTPVRLRGGGIKREGLEVRRFCFLQTPLFTVEFPLVVQRAYIAGFQNRGLFIGIERFTAVSPACQKVPEAVVCFRIIGPQGNDTPEYTESFPVLVKGHQRVAEIVQDFGSIGRESQCCVKCLLRFRRPAESGKGQSEVIENANLMRLLFQRPAETIDCFMLPAGFVQEDTDISKSGGIFRAEIQGAPVTLLRRSVFMPLVMDHAEQMHRVNLIRIEIKRLEIQLPCRIQGTRPVKF